MTKHKALRFGLLTTFLVMVTAVVLAFTISAHAAAPSKVTSSTAKTAHVSILRTKAGVVFGKSTITVTHGTPFQFDNRTKVSQSVTSNGKTVLTINAKSSAPYSFAKSGTYTFGLTSNSAAKLTVTVQ